MVILTLKRKDLGETYTAGELLWDGIFFSDTLEDKDRGLTQFTKSQAVEQIKVHGETAIPYGFYEVVIDMSTRFKKLMPHVLNVNGFDGIRIHGGMRVDHTEGCPLLGMKDSPNSLRDGFLYSKKFMEKLTEALKTHRVFLSVTR